MINLDKIAKDGIRISDDGKIYNKYGTTVRVYDATVFEFGWFRPGCEYHFNNYELSEYSIVKSTQWDEWYLKKNDTIEICRLRHLGGKNWETF